MARLQEHYQKTVVPSLMEQFKYSSAMQVPRITKITLNMGVGEAVADKKAMEAAVEDFPDCKKKCNDQINAQSYDGKYIQNR